MKRNGFEVDIDWDDDIQALSRTTLPDPTLLDYYSRLSQRQIFVNDYIDDELVEYSLQIIKWNKDDRGKLLDERIPIRIFINTDGGSLNAAMNFINVIKLSKTPIYTIAMGKAYSAGGLLLMAGHKRLIFPDTTVLIHDGSTGAIGDTGKVIDNLEFTKEQEDRLKKYILANTKITPKMYDKNYRRDWWLFSDQIIEIGVADTIIADIDEII